MPLTLTLAQGIVRDALAHARKAGFSGALAFNVGSRKLGEMAVERPHFFAGAAQVVGGLVPVAGGVLTRDANAAVIGAVGVSGDNSDNDEAAAIAGIAAAGLTADGG